MQIVVLQLHCPHMPISTQATVEVVHRIASINPDRQMNGQTDKQTRTDSITPTTVARGFNFLRIIYTKAFIMNVILLVAR